MASERSYTLAIEAWRSYDNAILIKLVDGTCIAYMPLPFIRAGGNDSWHYVHEVAQDIVQCDQGSTWELRSAENDLLPLDASPFPCTVTFTQLGSSDIPQLARGPEYFTSVRPANTDGSSTRSRSSRSTVNQSRFRMGVIARDSVCLLTDEHFDSCEAVHIVPQSRPDVYRLLLGIPSNIPPPLFQPEYGLLLRKDLHRGFDRLDFSFYVRGEDLVLHAFTGSNLSLHGKIISPSRFHGLIHWRPDKSFLRWHYKQCLMAHFRGFSVGMSAST